MKAATREQKSRWSLHKLALPAVLASTALVLMICQAIPTQAATMEEELNDFLRGPPFESGFNELQPAGKSTQTEALKLSLRLPPIPSKSTEPTLEQIQEFARMVQGDTYASPREDAARYAFGLRQISQSSP